MDEPVGNGGRLGADSGLFFFLFTSSINIPRGFSLVSLIRSCFLLGARLVRMIIMTYAQVACQSHDWGKMLRTKGWSMYRID